MLGFVLFLFPCKMGYRLPIYKENMKPAYYLHRIQKAFETHKIVALLGPRHWKVI